MIYSFSRSKSWFYSRTYTDSESRLLHPLDYINDKFFVIGLFCNIYLFQFLVYGHIYAFCRTNSKICVFNVTKVRYYFICVLCHKTRFNHTVGSILSNVRPKSGQYNRCSYLYIVSVFLSCVHVYFFWLLGALYTFVSMYTHFSYMFYSFYRGTCNIKVFSNCCSFVT